MDCESMALFKVYCFYLFDIALLCLFMYYAGMYVDKNKTMKILNINLFFLYITHYKVSTIKLTLLSRLAKKREKIKRNKRFQPQIKLFP